MQTYPDTCYVQQPNMITAEYVNHVPENGLVAEVGVYEGLTTQKIAKALKAKNAALHIFDFEDRVEAVGNTLKDLGYTNFVAFGNTRKLKDSYNWQLMRLLVNGPIYDYVFLDGAHSWDVDALAFFLIDRLLKIGGYLDFDDYGWSFATSRTMNPSAFPPIKEMYTDEQIATSHVTLIVELLVKRDNRYQEIVPNKIYRKVA